MGKPKCSSIARTPLPAFTYANTRRLPPHLAQANTSKSNVLFSNPAQSTRGVLSFICSFLAAASLPALASSAWGSERFVEAARRLGFEQDILFRELPLG